MIKSARYSLLLIFASAFFLAGCGRIEIHVSDLMGSPRFHVVENITMYDFTTHTLGILQRAGANDFWQRLAELCRMNGWKFKEKSVNRLSITADFAKDQTAQATSMLGRELAWTANGYEAAVSKEDTSLLPATIKIEKKAGLFVDEIKAYCDYDWNFPTLIKKLGPPHDWMELMQYAGTIPITVTVDMPYEVVRTNGQYDPKAKTCSWTFHVGNGGRAVVVFRIINWVNIGICAAIAFLVIALGVVALVKSRSIPAQDKPSEQEPGP